MSRPETATGQEQPERPSLSSLVEDAKKLFLLRRFYEVDGTIFPQTLINASEKAIERYTSDPYGMVCILLAELPDDSRNRVHALRFEISYSLGGLHDILMGIANLIVLSELANTYPDFVKEQGIRCDEAMSLESARPRELVLKHILEKWPHVEAELAVPEKPAV